MKLPNNNSEAASAAESTAVQLENQAITAITGRKGKIIFDSKAQGASASLTVEDRKNGSTLLAASFHFSNPFKQRGLELKEGESCTVTLADNTRLRCALVSQTGEEVWEGHAFLGRDDRLVFKLESLL